MPRSADEERSNRIRSDVMEVLSESGSPLSRNKIRSKVTKRRRGGSDGSNGDIAVTGSEIKKALKKLVRAGDVEQRRRVGGEGKDLFILSQRAVAEEGEHKVEQSGPIDGTANIDINDGKVTDEDIKVPFAEMMRRRRKTTSIPPRVGTSLSAIIDTSERAKRPPIKEGNQGGDDIDVDIDDEIRRLEAELAQDDSEDSDFDCDKDVKSDDCAKNSRSISFRQIMTSNIDYTERKDPCVSKDVVYPTGSTGIVRLSEVSDDRIAPLPPSALPQIKRRRLKGIDGSDEEPAGDKRKRRREDGGNSEVSDGLKRAVKEVLDGYVARSNQRLPFYCRVCSIQSDGKESFLAHKATDFHMAAVQAERKATYCQACRKQFTSPVQMKEHLQSRPHREKIDFLKARQRGEVVGRGGRGGQGRKNRNDRMRSKKQWC